MKQLIPRGPFNVLVKRIATLQVYSTCKLSVIKLNRLILLPKYTHDGHSNIFLVTIMHYGNVQSHKNEQMNNSDNFSPL